MRSVIAILFAITIAGCNAGTTTYHKVSVDDAGAYELPADDAGTSDATSRPIDNTIDGGYDSGVETTSGCGATSPTKCEVGAACVQNADCQSNACRYDHVCIAERSCTNHLGSDTCGSGEVGQANASHESCCKSLLVDGYSDSNNPGKQVYVDKYEITAGRVRTFIAAVIDEMGKPDLKGWVAKHRPTIWNDDWTKYLPSDYEGDTLLISRYLLGDPRHIGQTQAQAGPGVILVPDTDQYVSTGLNHQFGGSVFTETHGENCGTFAGAYGFPTFYYPDSIMTLNGETPRKNPLDENGNTLNAQDVLDSKSMNCMTNLMFHLFCSFDGGQLQTSDAFDFITDSPTDRPINISGCGSQYSDHGNLLGNITSTSVFTGGRCADAYGGGVNLFFDAGQALPVAGSPLNTNFYHYPDYGTSTNDKVWIVAAPGRMSRDVVRINATDEGWHDMAGNLTETVLETKSGTFDGLFSLRGQGVGFGSERSDMIVYPLSSPVDTGILRGQRPEVKSGLVGARCQYYR
jgi:hypothetical protein